MILFSTSGASISFQAGGEYVTNVFVGSAATALTMDSNDYFSDSDIVNNAGATLAAGTLFEVGHADGEVAPQIGDSVNLATGAGGVLVRISDLFNQPMPAGTTVSVSAGTDGCTITNSPGFTVASTNFNGPLSTFIALSEPQTPASGSAPITVTVTTPNSNRTVAAFNCSH